MNRIWKGEEQLELSVSQITSIVLHEESAFPISVVFVLKQRLDKLTKTSYANLTYSNLMKTNLT